MRTHETAGQAPFVTGSRMATHSTWCAIEKRSQTARREKQQVRPGFTARRTPLRRPERHGRAVPSRSPQDRPCRKLLHDFVPPMACPAMPSARDRAAVAWALPSGPVCPAARARHLHRPPHGMTASQTGESGRRCGAGEQWPVWSVSARAPRRNNPGGAFSVGQTDTLFIASSNRSKGRQLSL